MYGLEHERVGNAQRAVVLELLGSAVEQGFIDLHEYEGRLVRVTESKSVGQLYAQVADLPPQFRWDPQRPPPPGPADRRRAAGDNWATVSLILGAVGVPLSLCFGAGGLMGAAGVFFGVRALRQGGNPGRAAPGLALSIVGIALSLALMLVVAVG